MLFTLPALSYPTDSLEPFYDKTTLEIHHGKHHQAYVDKLNKAISNTSGLVEKSLEDLLSKPEIIPERERHAILNNAGGHANHSLFWQVIGPSKGGEPKGMVAESIRAHFDDFASFKKQFSAAALDVFGSGWTFLVQTTQGELKIQNLPNQESPITQFEKPILLLDLWEHAYYLKWQNRRVEWIESFWNLVDWEKVDSLLKEEPAWMELA